MATLHDVRFEMIARRLGGGNEAYREYVEEADDKPTKVALKYGVV